MSTILMMNEVKHPSDGWDLVSQYNPVVGQTQWRLVQPDYDYAQEVARSAYGDMLHDTDRNHKYRLAIEHALKHRRSSHPGEAINVLDIGTGTGLLAMIAARAGADKVTACEAFLPVANCARTVLLENGLSEKINLVTKRSNKLVVGCDLSERANFLVAELLDTELIGEAALSTYKHAAECLLMQDATLVPYAADLYLQVVDSPFLWSFNRLKSFPSDDNPSLIRLRDSFSSDVMQRCPGAPSVFDIQASELEALETDSSEPLGDRQLRCLLAEPVRVKRFEFGPPSAQIKLSDSFLITKTNNGDPLVAVRDGSVHAFIVWWRLKMEPTDTVPDISTAPKWANDPEYAWRDHWMQAVYFPRNSVAVRKGDPLGILFNHDSFALWFDLAPVSPSEMVAPVTEPVERPVCGCGMHYAWSRDRIAHLNTEEYRMLTGTILDRIFSKLGASSALDLVVVSDCSLLPLMVAELSCVHSRQHQINVHHVETALGSLRFLEGVYAGAKSNGFNIHLFESMDKFIDHYKQSHESISKISPNPPSILMVAEPYTAAGTLPWDSVYFWYARNQLVTAFPSIPPTCLLCPSVLRIYGVLVELRDLWKIRASINSCEGFILTAFDDLVQSAMRKTDAFIEPHPLWEYPSKAASLPVIVFEMKLDKAIQSDDAIVVSHGCMKATSSSVNAIAFWAEWCVPPDQLNPTSEFYYSPAGPSVPVVPGQPVRWKPAGPQQGVLFVPTDWSKGLDTLSDNTTFSVDVIFNPLSGEHSFSVSIFDADRLHLTLQSTISSC
ncbi:hypothetical protein T265_10877 [Opisthorchis viverrini]|uniref:Protein arginine N-methyltransferase domain-containing protein n=1 Tax=Opisthorchis viverrini TaxID=6198 RepID=A0A074Z0Y7_OPIVI|nr:hypothetical protein T265_10877 [Opisthorchis viverrini]KER20623.1 hypothetical protein T265_10877 [Opisthorchis viverrini]